MKNVIIVDVSINSKSKEKSIIRKIKSFIKEKDCDYDLYCFDIFAYQVYDLDDFIDNEFEYGRPCAYYDCLMEIIRLYAGRNKDKAEFHIISEHIDDCSRLADEEIFERYIQHIRSNYDALVHFTDYSEPDVEVTSCPLSSLFYKLKFSLKWPNFIRYSEYYEEDDDYDTYDERPYYIANY